MTDHNPDLYDFELESLGELPELDEATVQPPYIDPELREAYEVGFDDGVQEGLRRSIERGLADGLDDEGELP